MECPVCYIAHDDTMKDFYECNHLLCSTCHKAWHQNQTTCPICRAPEYNTPKPSFMIHSGCITKVIMYAHFFCIYIFIILFWIFDFEPEYNY